MLPQRWRWRTLRKARAAAAAHCARLRPFLAAPLPPPRLPVRGAPLLAVDLEMTGLDPATDGIVSIGWVPIDAGSIELGRCGELRVAAEAERPVGASATVHGIRDCDRADGTALEEALERLLDALAGRVAVFHHAPLDTRFLDRAMRQAFGTGWCWPSIDTLAWHRRRQLERHDEAAAASTRLDAVRDYYGLPPRAAHDALDDAISCAEVAVVLAARSRARLIDVCNLPERT